MNGHVFPGETGILRRIRAQWRDRGPYRDLDSRGAFIDNTNNHWRAGALAVLPLALFAGVMALDPIAQPAAYHDFADQRFLLGVPNLLDVASGIAFVIVGVLGIAQCAGPRSPPRVASWMAFFIATVLSGFGSIYYHWTPNDATLVWDRLPIALAAMALLVALVAEHLGEGLDRFMLAPALAAGAMSVAWWWWSGDLRPYVWVQFSPLLCILLLLAIFPARHTHRRFILYAIGLYALAKAAEMTDKAIFALTAHVVSGHTLKHLLAAGAIFTLVVMLQRREAHHG